MHDGREFIQHMYTFLGVLIHKTGGMKLELPSIDMLARDSMATNASIPATSSTQQCMRKSLPLSIRYVTNFTILPYFSVHITETSF